MEITKSAGHRKITHDFGKALVPYWLSKYGFTCQSLAHADLDFIAQHPQTQERLGLFVTACCRNQGTEAEDVAIRLSKTEKVRRACAELGCTPYVALVIDTKDIMRVFVTSLQHVLELFPCGKTRSSWQMSERYLLEYEQDPEIYSFVFQTETRHWWPVQQKHDQTCLRSSPSVSDAKNEFTEELRKH